MRLDFIVIKDRNITSILPIYFGGLVLMLWSIFPNLGFTHDSRFYFDAGKTLIENGFHHPTYIIWPPLFPIIIFLLGSSPLLIAFFNLTCWALTMYLLTAKIFSITTLSKVQSTLLVVCMVFSTPIFLVHNFVWTEPPYLLAIFALLLSLDQSGKWWVPTIFAIIIVALRHFGVVVIASCFLAILIHGKGFLKNLPWVVGSAIFFVLWQWFVWTKVENLERFNISHELDFMRNYTNISDGLVSWVFPNLSVSLNLLMPLFFMAVIIWVAIRNNKFVITCLACSSIGCLMVMYVGSGLLFEDIERYLVIAYPIFILGLFQGVNSLPFKGKFAPDLLLGLFTLYTVVRTAKNAFLWHQL